MSRIASRASTLIAAPAAAAQVIVSGGPAPAELPLPALPPVNASCYAPPPVAPGVNRAAKVQLPTELRQLQSSDSDLQTIVRENNNYTTFNKQIVTQVNRNHLHTQRVITNENNFNTYITNKLVKVNDIHSQRVELVPGERRVFNSYQQSQAVEPARCLRADGRPCAQ